MEKSLKRALEELVSTSVKSFEEKTLNPKRIVICTSEKRINSANREAMNYTENLFLNNSFAMRKGITIKVIIEYEWKKELHKEGDYRINVWKYLTKYSRAS